jgi:non-specific serine/threonine protein kinase
VKELVSTGGISRALAWTPAQAHRFLQDIPAMEEAGVIVQVPNWWKGNRPPRPQVSVRIGDQAATRVGVEAMLDFSVSVALEGQGLTESEIAQVLASAGGLVRLRGQWIEVDQQQLAQALEHWKRVERAARNGSISFFEGMRLLAGADVDGPAGAETPAAVRQWAGISPGKWLTQTLAELRDPQASAAACPSELHATLRHYQQAGVHWLRFMTRLGLGACLADDMGLGKTIQVLALMLHHHKGDGLPASLLVVPASLIANWKAEIERFAPSLSVFIAHPSETDADLREARTLDGALAGRQLAITTYGMLHRIESLRQRRWSLMVLDEAQAIKNAATRQTRAVKEVNAAARIALTGTPVENRLSDLWSLFDFLNPGLLGDAKAFARWVKRMNEDEQRHYTPLRALIRPYILRRLKTDKKVIADLPDKTELVAYCGLSMQQAAMYEQSVRELDERIRQVAGIQRRGLVLAYLMRLKQICNHPAQWRGDGDYSAQHSGKFQRLGQICEELAQRQEKALVFSQFREITDPLADFLAGVFGRPGLVLHGGTAVRQRQKMVEAFGQDGGPPFFVLSLKAGGTGLNLTAACHVIHFDRWWNPAVENQATDRAFRIGQKRNVMVHKFVCRGTLEERIDRLIADKLGLSRELLDEGGEKLLTELSDQELLRFVALDVHKAVDL